MSVRFPGAGLSSVSVCRLVGACRFVRRSVRRLAPAFRVCCVSSGRLVRSSRWASRFPPSCSHRCSHCLIRHRSSGDGVFAPSRRRYRDGHIVKTMGLVACFLFYSDTRRFPQLRSSSGRGRGLSQFPLRCGVVILVPLSCVLASVSSPCVPCRLVSASRSLIRLVSSVGRPVFSHRARASSASSGGRGVSRSHGVFALRYPHAPFFSAHFPICSPIAIVVGSIRANRLTGHRGRRLFHMGHREDGNGKRQGSMKRKTGRDG